MTIEALLFDVDDTLYDFSTTWQTASRLLLEEVLDPYGLNANEIWPKFLDFNALIFRYVDAGEMSTRVARQLRWQVLETFYSLQIPNIEELIHRHLIMMRSQCVPYPDSLQTIQRLFENYRLGIVTNGPSDLLDDRLKSVGLAPYFPPQVRIAADQVGFFKPEPEIFQAALDALGTTRDHVIFIGDSWKYDVAGALDADIPVIWYNPRKMPRPQIAPILGEIHQLQELPHLLNRIEQEQEIRADGRNSSLMSDRKRGDFR